MAELQGIFYARFHPEKGPSVIEQVPGGFVNTRTNAAKGKDAGETASKKHGIIDFSDISSYVIPPYDVCGKSLSVRVGGGYKVLGWPMSLESETYERNRFTFDVCFVLREQDLETEAEGEVAQASIKSWEQVVRKTALFFQALELDDGVLSVEEIRMEDGDSGTVVRSLLEKVFEQLTTYGEACVRVDKIHTLNLRLACPESITTSTKTYSKHRINAWDVPLLVRALPSPEDWTYDLVLARIHPLINGVNHISRIAELAGVDVKLVRRAMKGLVALGKVTILDLFHFQAMYTITPDFSWFVRDEAMREECRRYVTPKNETPSTSSNSTIPLPTLYTALATSPSVHDFVLAHQPHLHDIDIRRLVTFGVLKGFLRRKHKYVLAVAHPQQPKNSGSLSGGKSGGSGGRRSGEEASREFDRAWRKAALSSGWATPPSFEDHVGGFEGVLPQKESEGVGGQEGEEVSPEDEKLRGFLDGTRCLDEVCVAMGMGERKVLERLRAGRRVFGEVVVVCK